MSLSREPSAIFRRCGDSQSLVVNGTCCVLPLLPQLCWPPRHSRLRKFFGIIGGRILIRQISWSLRTKYPNYPQSSGDIDAHTHQSFSSANSLCGIRSLKRPIDILNTSQLGCTLEGLNMRNPFAMAGKRGDEPECIYGYRNYHLSLSATWVSHIDPMERSTCIDADRSPGVRHVGLRFRLHWWNSGSPLLQALVRTRYCQSKSGYQPFFQHRLYISRWCLLWSHLRVFLV